MKTHRYHRPVCRYPIADWWYPDPGIFRSASFYPLNAQATALGAFTALSAVSGQYFLTQINNELQIVNNKLDDILNFLYGESKAELLSEINFVKYVHANFSSIMMHELQRSATIISLQQARRTAMKDIEFYLNDMELKSAKNVGSFEKIRGLANETVRSKNCIEMARQVYVISGLLELFFSQNYDQDYIEYLKNDMTACINRCDNIIVSCLSKIQEKLVSYKPNLLESVPTKEQDIKIIEHELEPYKSNNDSPIRTSMESTLSILKKKSSFYIDKSGEAYMQIAS